MSYVRLKDIAEKAGVSINTVSRSLKDKPDISAGTRERVKRIADELGYIPHANASGLRSNTTNTIGVVITHINNAFFSRILQGISDAISNYGYTIMTLSSNEDIAKEKKLFVTGCLAQRYKEELAREIPEIDRVIGLQSIDEIEAAYGLRRPAGRCRRG